MNCDWREHGVGAEAESTGSARMEDVKKTEEEGRGRRLLFPARCATL